MFYRFSRNIWTCFVPCEGWHRRAPLYKVAFFLAVGVCMSRIIYHSAQFCQK